MLKKLNKKGFTLAELLIVIAIIAILVAIAMPIFTSSLDEARLATHKANARAVKAAGVTEVLSSRTLYNTEASDPATAITDYKWKATATVDKDGNLGTVVVEKATADDKGPISVNEKTQDEDIKKVPIAGATYVVVFSDTDLSDTPSAAGG